MTGFALKFCILPTRIAECQIISKIWCIFDCFCILYFKFDRKEACNIVTYTRNIFRTQKYRIV